MILDPKVDSRSPHRGDRAQGETSDDEHPAQAFAENGTHHYRRNPVEQAQRRHSNAGRPPWMTH
ncbi:MAG TPA: hypothetical protein VJM33_12950 [Microthrixaceae bacterium]|nr:hypothetical protein [Microthrixaceae bacterium]